MRLVNRIVVGAVALLLVAAAAQADPVKSERVTGGALDLVWYSGFNTNRNLEPLSLVDGDPAKPNPSGDNTVGVLTNTIADSGGIAVATIDVEGLSDYVWEGRVFTGLGDTRRGLIVRANALNATTFYYWVIESGLGQVRFRKVVSESSVFTLNATLLATTTCGQPAQNTWHRMKVIANGNTFRLFWDDCEIATVVDDPGDANGDPFLTGPVGVYNFRFDVANVPVYFDDLDLTDFATPTRNTTWGQVKARYQ
jgi:hypothetical protein